MNLQQMAFPSGVFFLALLISISAVAGVPPQPDHSTVDPPPTPTTTSKPGPPSPPTTTTTAKPKPTSPPTTTTTSAKPEPPSPPTTTPLPTTTPTLPPTTPSPTHPTSTPKPTPAPENRKFDGPSFIGGIVLTIGLLAIGFVSYKFYMARTNQSYHTL